MKKKIVILGSRGFVGKKLVPELNKIYINDEVIGLSSQDLDLEHESETPAFNSTFPITLVICSGLKRNHGETIETFNRNVKIAENLFRLTSKINFEKVIYLSSCAVYGEDVPHSSISENQLLTPSSFYGMAKITTEYLLQKSCGPKLTILRPPTLYGENSDPNNYDPYGFLSKAFLQKNITLWGDGTELREFVFIDDLIKIIAATIESNFSGIMNTVSGKSYSFIEIIQLIEKITLKKLSIESRPRSKDKVDHQFETKLIKSTLPNITFTPLLEGLKIIAQKEFGHE